MRYVGIDPSLTRTGVAVLQGETVALLSIPSSQKLEIFQRQLFMVNAVGRMLRRGDIVIMEDFGVSARFAPSGRFVERIEICGMLKMLVPRITGLPWLSAQPSLLKLFVAGKASAKKTDVLDHVRRSWGENPKNDDEADAFGLAALAKAYVAEDARFAKALRKFESYGNNPAAIRKLIFEGIIRRK